MKVKPDTRPLYLIVSDGEEDDYHECLATSLANAKLWVEKIGLNSIWYRVYRLDLTKDRTRYHFITGEDELVFQSRGGLAEAV